MIITLNGPPGSGKSSVAELLSKKFNWPHLTVGGIRREKARELGLTLEEYNKLGETDPKTDLEVDEYIKTLGETQDNFIIDGRTAWYFIPHSVKIFLDIEEKKGAYNIFNDVRKGRERNEGHNINSEAQMLNSLRERMASDKLRYKKYYNLDVYDKNHYDYILDVTNLSVAESFDKVLEYINRRLAAEVDK
jgi:cytidylate kinase